MVAGGELPLNLEAGVSDPFSSAPEQQPRSCEGQATKWNELGVAKGFQGYTQEGCGSTHL